MELRATTDRVLIEYEGGSRRILKVQIRVGESDSTKPRPPLNLSLVLDRSGSMEGRKLELAKVAASAAVARLTGLDTVSIVHYDDQVGVALPATRVAPDAAAEASRCLSALGSRGATDLCAGWMRGCEEVARTLEEDAVGRVLLLTDGLANSGITDYDQIVAHVRELRARGVSTSTFGIGEDFDESLLSLMAMEGGGAFHYVADAESIPAWVEQEVGETAQILVPEAEVILDGLDDVEVRRPGGPPLARRGRSRSVAVGALLSGQELTLLLDVRFPKGRLDDEVATALRLVGRGEDAPRASTSVRWTFASGAQNLAQPVDRALRMERAELEIHRARREALLLNRRYDVKGSVNAIYDAVERIRRDALGDPAILRLAADLEAEAEEYREILASDHSKSQLAAESYLLSGRDAKGQAHRWKQGRGLPACVGVTLVAATPTLARRLDDGGECRLDLGAERMRLDWHPVSLFDSASEGPLQTPISPAEERALAEATALLRVEAGNPIGIVVIPRPFPDLWFSHWHPDLSVAVVSTFGIDDTNPTGSWQDLSGFLTYECLLHGLRAFGWVPEEHLHLDTRGCLFDFCGNRGDIDMKLQLGDFCPECRDALAGAGLYPAPAGEIAATIYGLAAIAAANRRRAEAN